MLKPMCDKIHNFWITSNDHFTKQIHLFSNQKIFGCYTCSDPRARFDPNGESEPKPWGRSFNFFSFRAIKFFFSKMSRPESPAPPEWRIRTGARFTLTFSFILSKHFINSFSCESGFSFGQAHNHLQIQSNSVGP